MLDWWRLLHNTARIGVVADPRDPGAGRLRLSGAGRKRQCGSDHSDRGQDACDASHAMPLVLLDPFARRPRPGKSVDTAQEYVELAEKASEPRTN